MMKATQTSLCFGTQNECILEHLRNNHSITPFEALTLFGCFRLSGRIYDLKKKGINVKRRMVTERGKTYAEYYL